ncbi:MAG: ATP-dependent Clp protease ATP-binding subunit [Candidatus Colwellbacteria bacterium]|nr:ATP-dependent Clp protease ATP-binding subunit [Candidatus Colwellbacteria bacterium]
MGLLDECLALAHSLNSKYLTDRIIRTVVSGKTGIPSADLTPASLKSLKRLSQALTKQIIGQEEVITKITSTVQRAMLGMRDHGRPLASFLILGPSGVGKTETIKILAEEVFGRKECFVRFDMSEFSQEHTVGRLIGAPPGYLGYEAGGALTNTLRKEPYSLVLLDEIEKAHPKIFDIFLQVLDSGRITSGHNETRFDCILIFNPLSVQSLTEIAMLEIKKIEARLSKHKVQFQADPQVLENRIKGLADARFGARPVKRFVEESCESLLVKTLFK